jgi:hypothetical protein
MRQRAIVFVCLLAVASLFLLSIRFLKAPQRSLNVDGFPLIRAGMLQSEVEELLGGPPGNYGRYAGGSSWMTCEGCVVPPGSTEKLWCDDRHRFEIYFDGAGRVVGIHRRAGYSQGPPLSSNWIDKIMAWLGL